MLIPVIAVLLQSCKSEQPIDRSAEYFKAIQGDWLGEYEFENDGKKEKQNYAFIIQDSFCGGIYTDFSHFRIHFDTLFLTRNDKNVPVKGEMIPLRILELNATTLRTIRLYDDNAEKHDPPDTIVYTRIKKKNNIVPSKITFSSSVCYGTCPAMTLDIDSIGNFRFLGQAFTDVEGGFNAKLSKQLYDNIVQSVRNLPINIMKAKYEAGITDQPDYNLVIEHNGKKETFYVYGSNGEPLELEIIFQKLMQLYTLVKLIPDKAVTGETFQNSGVYRLGPPLLQLD